MKKKFKKKSELSEQEKIEKLGKLPLSCKERMCLTLAFLGEKPIAEIVIGGVSRKNFLEGMAEDLKIKQELEDVLIEIGLNFKILETEEKDVYGFNYKRFEFLIGKDFKKIEELKKAKKESGHKKIGILFGYPETAVKAFDSGFKCDKKFKKLMLDEEDWWKNLTLKEKRKYSKEGFLYFLYFKLSKKDYKKEFETLKRWQKALEEKAPLLAKEIISAKYEFFVTKKEKKEYKKRRMIKDLKEEREGVEKVVSGLGQLVENGIKETIVFLSGFNIEIDQFFEGDFEKEKEIGPWILVCPKKPEKKNWEEDQEIVEIVKRRSLMMKRNLTNFLNRFYEKRKVSFNVMLGFTEVGYGFKLQSIGNEVLKISSPPNKKREKFKVYKKEMRDFTKFLKKEYSDFYKF